MMKTQQDFEKLVTDALKTGKGVLTFAWDLRLGLNYHTQKHWLFIATPMPAEGKDSVGKTDQLEQPWDLKAQVAMTLTEGCIQALMADGKHIFSTGSFTKLERVSDAMRHHSCELQYMATWKGTTVTFDPRQGRNEPCACGSGKKFKKCCGSPN